MGGGQLSKVLSRAALTAYSWVLRLLKPYGGLTIAAFNPLTRRLFAAIERDQVATLETGERTTVDVNDYHGRVLWLFGNNDFKVSRVCEALVRAGDVFLDIGANHGSIGFSVLRHVGPDGSVHFFEPQPHLGQKIQDMIAQEGSGRAKLHSVALYDRAGSFEMALVANHSGMATIADTTGRRVTGTITVETVAAGPYISNLVGKKPLGVKIDIEGGEPPVLQQLLNLENVFFIQFEGASNIADLQNIFFENDFAVYGLRRSIFLPAADYCQASADWSRYHDFLAIPRRLRLPEKTLTYRKLSEEMVRARSKGTEVS